MRPCPTLPPPPEPADDRDRFDDGPWAEYHRRVQAIRLPWIVECRLEKMTIATANRVMADVERLIGMYPDMPDQAAADLARARARRDELLAASRPTST